MSQCEVCGGESIEVNDEGVFFCTVCMTQSQEFIEATEETEGGVLYSHGGETSGQWRKKLSSARKRKRHSADEAENSTSWVTYEAYNVALCRQVEALISLGAAKELKGIVHGLWFRFLEKTGVVGNDEKRRKHEAYPRERDIQVLFEQRTKLTATATLKKYKKLQKLRKEISDAPQPQASQHAVSDFGYLEEAEAVIEKDPMEELRERLSFRKKKIRENVSRDAILRQYRTGEAKTRYTERMSFLKTFAFLYLGVVLLNEHILLSDIIRWAYDEKIPLRCLAFDIWQEFDFQADDNRFFATEVGPFHNRIRKEAGELAAFLKIESLPDKSLQLVAARFILDLDLPAALHGIVNKLIRVRPPKMPWCNNRAIVSIPNYEGRAAAFIIVALKLLFRLDDVTERRISEYGKLLISQELHTLYGEDRPFIFDDWRKHISMKQNFQFYHSRRCFRQYGMKDTMFTTEEHIKLLVKLGKKRRIKQRRFRRRFVHSEEHKIVCRPFMSLLKKSGCGENRKLSKVQPSSFPLTMEAEEVLLNECKNLPTADTILTTLRKAATAFRRTSLRYLRPEVEVPDDNDSRLEELGALRDQYYAWLTLPYEQYEMNHLNDRHCRCLDLAKPQSYTMKWLIDVFCDLLEMKPITLYKELITVELAIIQRFGLLGSKSGKHLFEGIW